MKGMVKITASDAITLSTPEEASDTGGESIYGHQIEQE